MIYLYIRQDYLQQRRMRYYIYLAGSSEYDISYSKEYDIKRQCVCLRYIDSNVGVIDMANMARMVCWRKGE